MVDVREPSSSREMVIVVHGESGRSGSLGMRRYGRHIVSSSNTPEEIVR
jgi:hypothetical protein